MTVGWEMLWERWRSSSSRRGPEIIAQRTRDARSSDTCWSRCTSSPQTQNIYKYKTRAVSFVTQLVLLFFFPLSWLVGGAESIRECSPLPSQESHQRTGVATERVRQSKRVLHLYFLSFSFIHLLCRVDIQTPIYLLCAHFLLCVCSRVTPLSGRISSRVEGEIYRSLSRERRSGYGTLRARSGSRERAEDRRQRSEERGRRADSSGPRARIPRPSPSPTGTGSAHDIAVAWHIIFFTILHQI